MSIDPLDFRQALGRFPTGVTVVTARDGDEVHGITVSAFLSLSLEPPLVGIAINCRAHAHGLLCRVPAFAVSILRDEQAGLSNHFAGRPSDLLEDPLEAFAGQSVVRGALAHLACRIVDRVATGDHTLVVGEIEALAVADGAPLVYFRSAYRRLA